jgi:hypothetical protein
MVRTLSPCLAKQRHRRFVRMVVPADVRDIIGKAGTRPSLRQDQSESLPTTVEASVGIKSSSLYGLLAHWRYLHRLLVQGSTSFKDSDAVIKVH